MGSHHFPKTHRLLTSIDFQHVFDSVEVKQGGKHFTFLARRNTSSLHRLGIIISKRQMARAVDRNRVKRAIRESFRYSCFSGSNTGANLAEPVTPDLDVIVLAKASSKPLSNQLLVKALQEQWQKLARKLVQSNLQASV